MLSTNNTDSPKKHPDFREILLSRHGEKDTICVSAYNGTFPSETFCNGVDEAAKLIESLQHDKDIKAIWTNIQRLKHGSDRRKKGETIEAYTNLTIDIDRRDKRDSDGNKVNATHEEREVLRSVAEKIAAFLTPAFGPCVFADSGNGFHLNWKLADIEPGDGQRYYRRVLSLLKRKFESPDVNCEIDASLADDTQVVTVWGTWNRKYPELLDRPQRQSEVLFAPNSQNPIHDYDLEIFLSENKVADAPLAEPQERTVLGKTTRQKADAEWLENYGVPDLIDFWSGYIAYESDSYDKDGDTHHPIAPCPCHESEDLHEHSHAKDCEIIEFADGGIGISCFSGELSLKQVIAKMNGIVGEKYTHRVYAEESVDDLLEEFGAAALKPGDGGVCTNKECSLYSEAANKLCRDCAIPEDPLALPQSVSSVIVKSKERPLASERDAKKKEALKQKPGRVELGHWVETIEGIQLMTRITVINAAAVKPEKQRWLWHNRVPAGAITWGVGKPGNAKSLWATDLAARVSSGADFPDGAKNENGPKKVLMYCGEDDIKRTVIPRLMAACANLANIELLDNQSFEVFDKEYNRIDRREIDLSQDCKMLSEIVKAHPKVSLLIIDPTTGVYGSKNTNHDKDMRPVMNDLRDLCEVRGLTIVGITHTNKRGDAAAIDQIQGASSIAGAARAAWLFTRDPESDDEHAHAMTCIKSNLSDKHDGLRLLTKAVEINAEVGSHPMIIWGEGTKMQADEANQALKEKRETKGGKRDVARLAILAMLSDGAKLSRDVYTAIEKLGHSAETIKRAAGELTDEREIYRKQRAQRWYMVLPEHLHEFEQQNQDCPEPEMVVAGDEPL
jgi:RecA-family ATPase